MHLDVGNGHSIYFEEYGNPNGIKILFLHGGPGLGFSEHDKAIFDRDKFYVLFIDQRGCGKSLPKGALDHNTTGDLISDIDRILEHLKIDSITIFGGSWGATLAVLYAANNPDKVSKLILRGFFPATKECTDVFIRGQIKQSHPKTWERVASHVPNHSSGREAEFYFHEINQSADNAKNLGYEWARYGLSLSRKQITDEELDFILKLEKVDLEGICIELNYALNEFFVTDGYIYEQARKINNTPTVIIHGKYDYNCPPNYAEKLASIITGSKLIIVDAGHSVSEKTIKESLIEELDRL